MEEMPGGRSDKHFDLGTLKLNRVAAPKKTAANPTTGEATNRTPPSLNLGSVVSDEILMARAKETLEQAKKRNHNVPSAIPDLVGIRAETDWSDFCSNCGHLCCGRARLPTLYGC